MQNVTIGGQAYSGVDTVKLTKTAGGTADYNDTSDANATASDIATGKTAYVNGSKVTGIHTDTEPTLTTKTVTANGTYPASVDSADGYSSVTVNVAQECGSDLTTKTITSNGTYNASADDADGYSSVTVNVSEATAPSGSVTITENGTYDVTNYASAIVNVASAAASGGSLPNGVAGIDFGTFTPETDKSSDDPVVVRHNLGAVPDGVIYGLSNVGNYANLALENALLYGYRHMRATGDGTLMRITNGTGTPTNSLAGTNPAAYGTYGGVLAATSEQITLGANGSVANGAGGMKSLKAGYTYFWLAFKLS